MSPEPFHFLCLHWFLALPLPKPPISKPCDCVRWESGSSCLPKSHCSLRGGAKPSIATPFSPDVQESRAACSYLSWFCQYLPPLCPGVLQSRCQPETAISGLSQAIRVAAGCRGENAKLEEACPPSQMARNRPGILEPV